MQSEVLGSSRGLHSPPQAREEGGAHPGSPSIYSTYTFTRLAGRAISKGLTWALWWRVASRTPSQRASAVVSRRRCACRPGGVRQGGVGREISVCVCVCVVAC